MWYPRPAVFKMALILPVLPFIFETFSSFFLRFMMNLIPLPALHELRDIVDFTHATAMELVRSRKAAMGSGKLNDGGKDVMSLLSISFEPSSSLLLIDNFQ